jgi:tetratricopeptide (TPR) repeat protein
MADFSTSQIHPPTDWAAFQNLCRDLWADLWNDPNAKVYGRQGQKQDGIDVIGHRNGIGPAVAVQCKVKDQRLRRTIKTQEIDDWLLEADEGGLALGDLTIATTAARDSSITRYLESLRAARASAGKCPVTISFWDDIQLDLADRPGIAKKHLDVIQLADIAKSQNALLELMQRAVLRAPALVADSSYSGLPDSVLDFARAELQASRPNRAIEIAQNVVEQATKSGDALRLARASGIVGAAHQQLGHFEVAADWFERAYLAAPEDERAVAQGVASYALRGDLTSAVALADKGLASHPESPRITATWLGARANALLLPGDPLDAVPEGLRAESAVLAACAQIYQLRGDLEKAAEIARAAVRADEDSLDTRLLLAEVLVSRAFDDAHRLHLGEPTPRDLVDLQSATQELQSLWALVRRGEATRLTTNVPLNLSACLSCVGEFEGALRVCDDAIGWVIDPTPVKRQRGLILLKLDRLAESAAALLEILVSLNAHDRCLLAEVLIAGGNIDGARHVLPEESATPSEDAGQLRALRVRIAAETGTEQELAALLGENERDPSVLVAGAAARYKLGQREEARVLALRAKAALTDDARDFERALVADELFRQGVFEGAAELYKGIVGTARRTPALRRYAESLFRLDRRADLVSFLAVLPPDVRAWDDLAEIEAALCERTGDLSRAAAVYEHLLSSRPNSLRWLVRAADVALRAGRDVLANDLAKQFANATGEEFDLRLRAVQLLGHLGQFLSAARQAYQLLRLHGDRAESTLTFFGLMLRDEPDIRSLHAADVVDSESEFVVRAVDTGIEQTIIVEDDSRRSRNSDEYPSSHPLVKLAIGRRAGDQFDFAVGGQRPRRFEISSVASKYRARFARAGAEFPARFPEDTRFGIIPIGTREDGTPDHSELVETLKRRKAHAELLEQLIRESAAPAWFLADRLGSPALEAWRQWTTGSALPFRTCAGTPEERTVIVERLRERGRAGAVIDAISLVVAVECGLLSELDAVLGDVGVVQSTIDELLTAKSSAELNIGRPVGTMMVDDAGQPTLFEYRADARQQWIDLLGRVIDAARTLSLIPSVPAGDIGALADVRDALPDAAMDSMLAADGARRVLVSEDLGLRQLAEDQLRVVGAPIGITLMLGRRMGVVSTLQAAEHAEFEASRNHTWISLDDEMLFALARRDNWLPSRSLTRLATAGLRLDKAQPSSAVEVAKNFLARAWGSIEVPSRAEETCVYFVVNALTDHGAIRAERAIALLLHALTIPGGPLRSNSRARRFRTYINRWVEGHFLI